MHALTHSAMHTSLSRSTSMQQDVQYCVYTIQSSPDAVDQIFTGGERSAQLEIFSCVRVLCCEHIHRSSFSCASSQVFACTLRTSLHSARPSPPSHHHHCICDLHHQHQQRFVRARSSMANVSPRIRPCRLMRCWLSTRPRGAKRVLSHRPTSVVLLMSFSPSLFSTCLLVAFYIIIIVISIVF